MVDRGYFRIKSALSIRSTSLKRRPSKSSHSLAAASKTTHHKFHRWLMLLIRSDEVAYKYVEKQNKKSRSYVKLPINPWAFLLLLLTKKSEILVLTIPQCYDFRKNSKMWLPLHRGMRFIDIKCKIYSIFHGAPNNINCIKR